MSGDGRGSWAVLASLLLINNDDDPWLSSSGTNAVFDVELGRGNIGGGDRIEGAIVELARTTLRPATLFIVVVVVIVELEDEVLSVVVYNTLDTEFDRALSLGSADIRFGPPIDSTGLSEAFEFARCKEDPAEAFDVCSGAVDTESFPKGYTEIGGAGARRVGRYIPAG
jgi:hypothetical protein